MTRTNRQVADCSICGRTGLGLVANFNGGLRREATRWRIAAHNRPSGERCVSTEASGVYELATPRAR